MEYQSKPEIESTTNLKIMAINNQIARIITQTPFIPKIANIGSISNELQAITVELNGSTSITSEFTHQTSIIAVQNHNNYHNNHNNRNDGTIVTTKEKNRRKQYPSFITLSFNFYHIIYQW